MDFLLLLLSFFSKVCLLAPDPVGYISSSAGNGCESNFKTKNRKVALSFFPGFCRNKEDESECAILT
jgi:hypothetical protein